MKYHIFELRKARPPNVLSLPKFRIRNYDDLSCGNIFFPQFKYMIFISISLIFKK